MSRSTLLFCFLALLTLLSGLAQAQVKRPNVLFIAADDLRPQLGCYGDKVVQSPNLDRLASRGVVFTRAYCQQALCSPSRISLLSGRYPTTTGIYTIGPALREKLPDVVTLPQHFKNQGYFTRSLGKIFHVGIDDPASWSVASFISKKPRYGPTGQRMIREYNQKMRAEGKEIPQRGKGASFYAGPAFEAPEVEDDTLADGDTAREAVEAIGAFAKTPDQPFFLAVGFVNPHVPWVAPKKYWDLYDPSKIRLPENRYPPKDAPRNAAQTGADFTWYAGVKQPVDEEFGRQCLHGYFAAISYVDAQVGRLLKALEENKLAGNTVVVFWGDHGYYMGEHGWWGGKHNNYEGATNAPLIVAAPNLKGNGGKSNGLVEFVDIYPSLVELCGLPASEGVEGKSFVPLLEDPTRPGKGAALSWYPKGSMGTAMRTERYRYVEWVNNRGELAARELYDHASDPQENQNLAGRAEQKALLDELQGQLRSHPAMKK